MLKFNGQDFSGLITVTKIEGRGPFTQEVNRFSVYGRPGSYYQDRRTPERPIKVRFELTGNSLSDIRKKVDQLNQYLDVNEPKSIVFSDEPDKEYFGMPEGQQDWDEYIFIGKGAITFLCPDPFKYGPLQFIQPVTDATALIVLNNEGAVGAPPNIKVTLKQSTTYLDIIGDKDYMRIGRPMDIDKAAVAEKEAILHDTMSTLTGWGDAANTDIDGGEVVGTMASDGAKFYASSFGTGSSWHGPAKIKSLGQELTDFEVSLQPILDNDDLSKIGRIELYLLDVNKNAVGKLAIKDISKGQGGNIVEIRIGDSVVSTFLINEYGTNWDTWHNFNGLLQLTKKGNKWTAYVCKFIDGQADQRTARKLVEWIDLENQFTRKVAHVVVHIGANGTSIPSQMSIQDLKIDKINLLTESQIPYIGTSGDVFEFDMKTEKILKNGDFFYRKDFGARFFYLKPGDNPLVFSPPEVIGKIEAEWRPPYR
ncbi:phage tail family protein [Mesobacillus subterraneus]|uniref:distal tail protein Dit n=1 Tax=Mesobacillus subterraneus TaxID=285983 RepID=UPI00203E8125|nr:distal tail protein Dit [Mesobacillus subterraneus]MCM3663446.1 phage tail family protein [Mesobacillus subterraneus]MCM3683216.1 phage tail family protein [Mesobacillus subterraneus]